MSDIFSSSMLDNSKFFSNAAPIGMGNSSQSVSFASFTSISLSAQNVQSANPLTGLGNGFASEVSNVFNELQQVDLSQEEAQKRIDELLDKLIEMQLEFLGRGNESRGTSAADIMGVVSEQAGADIQKQIDMITVKQVDGYIKQHGLNPDAETYQQAIDAVRYAVSGQQVADDLGLPQGMVASNSEMSVADEVALRMEQIGGALGNTLGGPAITV